MSEYEKMINGEIFDGSDPYITMLRQDAFEYLQKVNHTSDRALAQQHLFKLLDVGENSVICPPFHCEFGKHIHLGNNSLINMGAMMLDGAHINIGNHVLIAPNCQFYTASHSLDHLKRRQWETFCLPITIEDDVWVGGNVIINQGVTIGKGSVIASGSVVNKDVPPFSLVGGMPAKVIRKLLPDEAKTSQL
ncbi:sugar O-acetyltransferase [Thalassotalea aquiviva]|uniref:sugar O-acetyltransferase n=1 Tax=Thalassotalea aquiviva TaxID=3242415 RepID=UPI00352B4F13